MSDLTFLITTPVYEDAVFYLSKWSDEIIDEAKRKGFNIINLPAEKANKTNFEGHIKKQNPNFVMLNGHGSEDVITGHNKEPILEKGKNEKLMNGRIVYARSCYALSGLGKACVNSGGAKGFVGYLLPFMFMSDPNRCAHPLKDELASPCLSTSNLVPIIILKGQTISEAVDRTKSKMKELLNFWETREDLVEAPFVASCIYWNMQGLGFEGKPDTKLY